MSDFLPQLRKDPLNALKGVKHTNIALLKDLFYAIPEHERAGVTPPERGYALKQWLEEWGNKQKQLAMGDEPDDAPPPPAQRQAAPVSRPGTALSSSSSSSSLSQSSGYAQTFEPSPAASPQRPRTAFAPSPVQTQVTAQAYEYPEPPTQQHHSNNNGNNNAALHNQSQQIQLLQQQLQQMQMQQQQMQQQQQQQQHQHYQNNTPPSQQRRTNSTDMDNMGGGCAACKAKDIKIKKLQTLLSSLVDQLDDIALEVRGDLSILSQ